MMSNFKSFYTEFISQLSHAKSRNNPKEFQKLLTVVEPNWEAADQVYYVEYCVTKAGLFALFGENLDMNDWMQKAMQFSDANSRSAIYFKWIDLYWSQSKAVDNQSQLQAIFSNMFNVTTQAIKWETNKYNKIALESVRAFTLAALGKHAELEEELSQLKMEPIAIKQINNKGKLIHFYSHIYKMLIAALEIRNETLVFKILQMITIDDALIHSKAPLVRKFNTVVMDVADMRQEFAADFNTFYQMRKRWAGFLPNFSLFTMMIEEENLKGLDLFFKGME